MVELEGKGEEKAGTIKEQERKGEKGNRFGRVCVWICLLFEMKIQSVCRITLDWQALRSQPLICKSVCVCVFPEEDSTYLYSSNVEYGNHMWECVCTRVCHTTDFRVFWSFLVWCQWVKQTWRNTVGNDQVATKPETFSWVTCFVCYLFI